MPDLIRCKACGYVTAQGNVKDVCPACGVPAKMFEPYTHPVSLKRRRILDLHTHPIVLHFPQAFVLTLVPLSFFAFFAPISLQQTFSSTMQVLSFLLPFSVVATIATGLLDGKIRFRKVTTPLLKKKIFLSIVFLIVSITLPALALSGKLLTSPVLTIYFLLTVVASLCGVLLGLIGGRLLDAKFPG